MTDIAILLTFACFLAALFRARWVALALAPPCLLILARVSGLVDISSASHPARFVVPLLGLSLAMWAAWVYAKEYRESDVWGVEKRAKLRSDALRKLVASVLVFASDCTDIPALLAWKLPGEWVVVPLQIGVCLMVLVALLAPERWILWISSRLS